MQRSRYPQPVQGPAPVDRPPVRRTDQRTVTRMERLRRSRWARRGVLVLASLALAGLILVLGRASSSGV